MSTRRISKRSGSSLNTLHNPVRWAVESLERRLLLAAVSWTGGGDGINWTDPKNWSTNALPASTDTVTINAAGTPTLTIASGSQSVSTLNTSDPLTIASGASLAVGATLSGTGTLTNSGTLTLKSTTVSTPLVNQGMVTVINSGNSITGTFTASAGSTLNLSDNNNYAQLTVSSGFTNDGTISMSTTGTQGYTTTLTVTSGTLTNASDGTIAAFGTGTDGISMTAALTNQGAFNVQHNFTINNSSKTLALTSGTLSIDTGQTLKLSAGTLSLGSTTLSGTGTLDATSDTITLASGQTLTGTGVQIVLTNATVNGPGTLTNASGNTVTFSNTKVNAPLVNQGTLVVTSTGTNIAGGFTASPGSTLSLNDSNNYAQVTFAGAFTNDGTIAMSTSGTQGYNATLTISSSGTLTNASDGTITASGTGADSLIITAALNNQGTFNVQHALALNTGTGSSSNSGTINASAGDLTITQQSSTDVFTNTGALTVAAGHSLNFSAAILDLNTGGTVGGAGTLSLSNMTLNLGVSLSNGTTALNVPGTTINGPGTLTNASGETLTLSNTKVNAPLVNQGIVVVANSGNIIAGAFTASHGSTLNLNDSNNYAQLTVSTSFTNDGVIAMSTTGTQGYYAQLTMSAGDTLTNASDGTITASGSGSDALLLSGALTNQGTLGVQHDLTVSNGSSTLDASSGTLSIAAGQTLKVNGGTLTLGSSALSGTGTLDVTNDTVDLAGNQTLTAAGVQMILTSTTINGPGTLTNASGNTLTLNNTKVNAPLVNQGIMAVVGGSNAIAGAFTALPGSTLSLSDNNAYSQVTVSSGFTNDGTIALSTTGTAGYYAQLIVSSGTLTNASDGTITASGTGADALFINAALTNQGLLNAQHNLTVTNSSKTLDATSGTLSIASGQTLKVNGGTLTLGSTAPSGSGTLDLTGDTVNLSGNQTLTSTGVQWITTSATINGPGILTNAQGNTLSLNNTKVNAPLVNQGIVGVVGGSSTITGGLTASPGSTLSLDDNTNYADLSVSGFTNNGTISLSTESNAGYNATLTVSSGTLTNAANGTITASGNGADVLTIIGAVNDWGALNVQHDLTVRNGSLDATSGTVSIAAAKTLTVSSETLTLGTTVLSGTGTVNGTSDTINLDADQTLPAGGVQIVLTSATVNGPGILTNAGALTLNNTKVNAPLVNQGTIVATNGGNTITSSFTASPGSTLSLSDNTNYAQVTFSAGFTNDGTIALSTQSNAGYNATLIMSSGATLTNATDGAITASGTGADALAINGALTNQGTLSVSSVKLTLQNPTNLASNVLTGGTWQVSGGGKLILPSTITTNAAHISLDGPASIITNSGGTTNALSGLTVNNAGAGLTLAGGQALAVTPAGGSFTNSGTLTAGAGSELSVTGAFSQATGGLLSVQIGGPTGTNFGQVVASGTATAGGNLQAFFVNSYDPPATQEFAVLNGANETGTFVGTVVGQTPGGRFLTAHYNATSALIAILPLRPSTPVLTAASDSGISQTDGITNVNTPTYTGNAFDAGTIQLYANGTLIGTGTIAADGTWSVQTSTLADGIYVITAAVMDTIGDLGPIAEGPGIHVDTVAPTIHATINAPGSTGWYNLASGKANVHYAAFDNPGGSGLASAVPANYVFADGSNQSLAGVTISDIAGNTATSESFSGINQDTVAPTIHATINAPAASGWYNIATGPADVHYTASDNTGGSGLASAVPADHVFLDGVNQSLAGVTISDLAGNTATSESFSGIKQDTAAPASSVAALPAKEGGPFTLNWSGQDNVSGSGLADYSVYVSDNGGAYTALVLNTASTSQQFTGQVGHTYGFYSTATDVAGNVQPTPTSAQATTIVTGPPSVSSISPATGPAVGGTTVMITGVGFTQATAVDFGSTPASSFTVNAAGTQILAVDPAGSGTVDVTVTTPDGTTALSAADKFTYALPTWLAPGSSATWNLANHTLTVSGAATIIGDPGSDEPNIVAQGTSAKLMIAPSTGPADVHVGGLTLNDGAIVTMASVGAARTHNNHNVLVIGTAGAANDPTVHIDAASKLDLADNDLIVHTGTSDATGASELTAWQALAQTGRGVPAGSVLDGTWTGNGLTSSAAAATDKSAGYEETVLAVIRNNDQILGTDTKWTVGTASEAVGAKDIIVKYTYNGDAAMEGFVGDDSVTIVNGLYDGGKSSQPDWAFGDFTGSGGVNDDDITILNGLYGNGTAASGLPVL